MNLNRFQALIDAYGADAERWPFGERDAAEALLEESGAARAILSEARTLDALLADAPPVAVSPALKNRVLDIAEETHQQWIRKDLPRPFRLSLSFFLPRLAGVALAAYMGFIVGGSLVNTEQYSNGTALQASVDLSGVVFGEDYEEDWQ